MVARTDDMFTLHQNPRGNIAGRHRRHALVRHLDEASFSTLSSGLEIWPESAKVRPSGSK
jgi:hypothetical protein